MIVYAIKDLDTGLFWNRIHKDFRPLAQNTLFVKDTGQARRALDPRCISGVVRDVYKGRNLDAVKIEMKEHKEQI